MINNLKDLKKNKKGFNTTLLPDGLQPQYWASSNQFKFHDRMRTDELLLIWLNPIHNCNSLDT